MGQVLPGIGAAAGLLGGGVPSITPYTSTYDSSSGNEPILEGSASVRIRGTAGGGGGARQSNLNAGGGGGGGQFDITRAVLPSEWGSDLAWSVGAPGTNETGNTALNAAAGGNSTVTGTLNGEAISLSANGGGATNGGTGGTGGTASGGDSNYTGNNGTGGNQIDPGPPPVYEPGDGGGPSGGFHSGRGDGGNGGSDGSGGGAAPTGGRITFEWS